MEKEILRPITEPRIIHNLFIHNPIPTVIFNESTVIIDLNLKAIEIFRQSRFFDEQLFSFIIPELKSFWQENTNSSWVEKCTELGGKRCCFSVHFNRIRATNNCSEAVVAYFHDITERKRQEDEYEALKRQAVKSAKLMTLGEMAAGIAHEVSNPLAVIMGLAQLNETKISEGKNLQNKDLVEIFRKIHTTGSRIVKIMNSLRIFAREEDDPHLIESKLNEIVENTVSFIAEKFKTSAIQVDISAIPSEIKIKCRPIQIEQVLINLFSNSCYAVADLKERWVKVEAEIVDEQVRLRVIDSGLGIPVQVRRRMMEPFYTTKNASSGTGLGLSISKTIIEAHGGKICYVDDAFHTTFEITLPQSQTKSDVNRAS